MHQSWSTTTSSSANHYRYVTGATSRLEDFISSYGDAAKAEINDICSAHVLTMDVDLTDVVYYCGAKVADNKLVIVFNKDNLSSNASDAFGREALTKALNNAPSSLSMSYLARKSVADYNKEIGEIQSIINDQFGKEITLDPGFEVAYDKLKAAKKQDGFDENLGSFILGYFRGLAKTLEREKVKEDDMVQEALNEAAEFGRVSFRIVNPGEMNAIYGEAIFENGVLYVQTDTEHYGSNIEDAADKLLDQL